ncbi:hypothetical protein FSP39_023186 [Pinctada imbricata]|uniref:Ubiquitin-related modifier 1 n=1 Tax=Pinctada imbricata TaxID=66713 RepID=A0AA88XU36_PINIB|nr:hypothetical protein FSP39_023186 [Pinctada imbricata]
MSFEKIDVNGDGRLSKSELMKAAALLGFNPTEKELTEMMRSVDRNNDGFISFKEYIEMMKGNYININMEAERMKAAFKTLDKNNDGYISLKEFKAAVMYNDDSILAEEVEEFFKEFDKDGDGKLDYNGTLGRLLPWIRDNLLRERPELFMQGETVRPGILVLVNDADWELMVSELLFSSSEN